MEGIDWWHILINVLNHVLFLTIVLFLLFHFVIRKISFRALDGAMKTSIPDYVSQHGKNLNEILDILDDFDDLAGDSTNPASPTHLKGIEERIRCLPDPHGSTNNAMLYGQYIMVIIGILVLYLTVIFVLGSNDKERFFDAADILMENFGAILVIGGIEGIFFWFFARHYMSDPTVTDPNEIAVQITEHAQSAIATALDIGNNICHYGKVA